jgi:hypothetical protein
MFSKIMRQTSRQMTSQQMLSRRLSQKTDYGKASRVRLVNDRRFRHLSIMPTIKEEEELEECNRMPITYQEAFGIQFCLPAHSRPITNADDDENDSVCDDIYEELLISLAKIRHNGGRQEKRCAGKLESTRNSAQQVKKTAKIIATRTGLATILEAAAPEKDLEERSKPTKSDLRLKTNKLTTKRAYKIQQACPCICDKAILKSVGCNCI